MIIYRSDFDKFLLFLDYYKLFILNLFILDWKFYNDIISYYIYIILYKLWNQISLLFFILKSVTIYIYILNSFGFKKKIFLKIDKYNCATIKRAENIVKRRNDKKSNKFYCVILFEI